MDLASFFALGFISPVVSRLLAFTPLPNYWSSVRFWVVANVAMYFGVLLATLWRIIPLIPSSREFNELDFVTIFVRTVFSSIVFPFLILNGTIPERQIVLVLGIFVGVVLLRIARLWNSRFKKIESQTFQSNRESTRFRKSLYWGLLILLCSVRAHVFLPQHDGQIDRGRNRALIESNAEQIDHDHVRKF